MKEKLIAWSILSTGILLLKMFVINDVTIFQGSPSSYPFVILGLCLVFGWIKKDAIAAQMDKGQMKEPAYLIIGFLIILVSIIMPPSADLAFMIFNILLIFVGTFLVLFGTAAYYPSILLFIYGFSISFPVILNDLVGTQYALITTRLTADVAGLIYPVGFQGQVISIVNSQGVRDLIFIDAECSGSASMAIFLTIFALMLIDIRPHNKYLLPLFIFGLLGTSFQNIFRLVLLLVSNYYLGSETMWQIHTYAGYILFPLWFAVFVYVYLKVGIISIENDI